ncbi:MAG TPA: hypothetical protein VMU83_10700 [Hanamia sp.]|nr:hypothetical protein [Hanamia sp.]
MKLTTIFVDENCKGLHSFCYKEHDFLCEFDRLFNLWNNPVYIRRYLKENISYLQGGFYGDITLEEAITEVRRDIQVMQSEILRASINISKRNDENLECLFRPFHNLEIQGKDYQEVKYKLEKWEYKKSKIRLYAIRLSQDTFIITGGAIKLVKLMEDHVDTVKEKEKLKLARNWLKANDFLFEDNLKEYYEEE